MNSGGGSRCAGVSSSSRPGDSAGESVYFDPTISLYIDAELRIPTGWLDPDPDFEKLIHGLKSQKICSVQSIFKNLLIRTLLRRKAERGRRIEKKKNDRNPEKIKKLNLGNVDIIIMSMYWGE